MKESFRHASDDTYYVPSEFLEKYPLVKKALDEQKAVQFHMDPMTYQEDQPRILQILEDTLQRPLSEKEALMAASILTTGPANDYNYDYTEEAFGKETRDILQELNQDQGYYLSKNTAQLIAAHSIREMEKRKIEIFTSDSAMLEYRRSLETPTATGRLHEMHERLMTKMEAPYLKRLFQRTHMTLQAAAGIISLDASSFSDERPDFS